MDVFGLASLPLRLDSLVHHTPSFLGYFSVSYDPVTYKETECLSSHNFHLDLGSCRTRSLVCHETKRPPTADSANAHSVARTSKQLPDHFDIISASDGRCGLGLRLMAAMISGHYSVLGH